MIHCHADFLLLYLQLIRDIEDESDANESDASDSEDLPMVTVRTPKPTVSISRSKPLVKQGSIITLLFLPLLM